MLRYSRANRSATRAMATVLAVLSALLLLQLRTPAAAVAAATTTGPRVCIVGSGIGGASVAHFLKHYTCAPNSATACITDIRVIERSARPGGRTATVDVAGDTFEAGASIIHPKNLHALRFAALLNLSHTPNSSSDDGDDSWFGVWDGAAFRFKTLPPTSSWLYNKIRPLLNSLIIFRRYGLSLLKMSPFVKKLVDKFLLFYTEVENRPVFETVEEMLEWSGLYGLTRRTLQEELADAGFSPLLISELVTVITRINYGQSVSISALAGAVSLAGSDSGLWSVDGGNWQLAAGLIKHSKSALHLQEEIASISHSGNFYVLNSTKGNQYNCEVTVLATPLDELNISFTPSISVPARRLQHTFTTFVRGLLNPKYFGLKSTSEIPDLVGTIEDPDIPFSSISVLKKYSEEDKSYKVFSRSPLGDDLLDQLFSTRTEIVRIDWPAYPYYEAPEVFAPIVLDQLHLYYINSFESAASSIECSAVAAENVARLIISRLSGLSSNVTNLEMALSAQETLHTDL